jgi:hypothetical protein
VADEKAARLALELIREADPPVQATVEVYGNMTPDDVDALSYRELLALAQYAGIPIREPDLSPPEAS